jgi:hypothetical protein
MTEKNQTLTRDFTQLAMIHARDGEAVSRSVINAMKPEARDELYAMAHALTSALKVGPGKAGPHVSDFIGPVSATSVTAEAEKDLTIAASDALSPLRRINQ